MEPIHGLNTYVVGNRTNPRAIVVMYSDVLELPNNKLIADAYAGGGDYLVYLPDFFKGDPVRLAMADVLIPVDAANQSSFSKYTGLLANLPSFLMWMSRHGQGPTERVCVEFLQRLRRSTPRTQRIGMVGFCWGGRYAIRAGAKAHAIEINGAEVPLVDAIVAMHPSNLVLPNDVEQMTVPTSFGWGVEDTVVSFEQKAKVEELHTQATKAGQHVPEMEHKVYTPGRHGFGVRGNPDEPLERECLEGAEAQVLAWFRRWL